MKWFGKKKTKDQYLGVDIGSSGIKVVELANKKGRAALMTYGYSERDVEKISVSPLDDTKATGKLLAQVCKRAGVESKTVMTALPPSNVFSAIISIPAKEKKKDMKPAIDSQVAKLTPVPLEDMVTYSTFIDDPKKALAEDGKNKEKSKKSKTEDGRKREHVRVLVTGAAKSLVQKYIEIFNYAKLDLEAVDTESFALIRSLVGKDKSPIMLIDMGSVRTHVAIAEQGIPFLARSINVGGNAITKKIMEQMNISREEAEQTKRDFGTLSEAGEGRVGEIPPVFESALNAVVQEAQYALELYAKMDKTPSTTVEKIILTGGTSHIPNVTTFLADRLNINVYRGDPWARVVYPKDLRPVLDEIGPKMSVAIGLAMRDID